MAVSGDLLDLRSVGIDVPEDQEGLPFRVTTLTSGEMYEWAEKSWRYLRNDGFDGVIVKQWHAELSAKPYAALLLWGASDG
jgi:hypothetical protein